MLDPESNSYLNTPYDSKPSQKGGTLIAEDVVDLAEHQRRVQTVDDYRPDGCPRCQHTLQGHACRWRSLKDQPGCPGVYIRRYRCVNCQAVWQVLPALIARYLHRTWEAVQSRLVRVGVLSPTGTERRVPPKPSTTRRWVARLWMSAAPLTGVLADAGPTMGDVIGHLGTWCSRRELVEGVAQAELVSAPLKLAQLAGWIHRVVPGVRLM